MTGSDLAGPPGEAAVEVAQRVVAGGSAQVAALGTGTQIVNFFGSPERMPPVPAMALNSLPRDFVHFTDRADALSRITEAAGIEDAASIVAIDGMAGVGKTALAVRAAHQLAPLFPDAQLYLDLHAHSRGRTPVDPDSALETLLRVLGVPAREIPDSLDGRAALWRSRLANRRTLVVLDNAAASHQVRPLLPGSRTCLVIVTSRPRLTGLREALRIGLGVLVFDDAIRLFMRIVGPEKVGPDQEAVRQIVQSCARLPLAVSLCAARLKYRPVLGARHLAAALTKTSGRLAEIRAEDETVASVFELSYTGLDPDGQRMFRRLGLHPAQDFSVEAAAALAGADLAVVRRRLEDLCDQNLVQEPRFGRYLLHDLLHEYARRLAEELEPPAERALATDRLLDYYTFVAAQADRLVDLLGSRDSRVEWEPVEAPRFASHLEATAWVETERANLHAMVRLASEAGRPARAARLARTMVYVLRLRGYWRDVLDLGRSGGLLFDRIGDRAGAADMGFYCGDVLRLTGRHEEALRLYQTVLTAYRDLADRHREARTLHSIGDIERAVGRFASALDRYQAALAIYRELGHVLAEARALHSIADAYRLSGRQPEAVDRYRRVLPVYRALDDAVGEARVRLAIGDLHRAAGSYDQARADCQHSLDAFRLLGDRLGEADAELSLGEIDQARGSPAGSLRHYRRARMAYRELGDQSGYARTLQRSGGVLIAAGRHEAGVVLLREALVMFEALDASAEADQVRAELDAIRD